ncbi:hypothetical protein [Sphingobium amiense]|uniref:hypothetical protein n=1 Tax=Sphingobium amiense TaxID=135719 RepID=UPI000AD80459|nr:hypothetical protein [Sphingobium amiense]
MSFVDLINAKRAPGHLPFTRGEIAAQRAREAADFHTLPQAERDRRVMAAMEAVR